MDQSEKKQKEYRSRGGLSPADLNEVSMQRFRMFAMGALVKAATDTFVSIEPDLLREPLEKSLLAMSAGETLR